MERKFYRKYNDRVFGGVCSGLAEYAGIDKSLVRILTLIGTFASGGLGLVLYVLCVIIVPYDTKAYNGFYNENDDKKQYNEENSYSPSGRDYEKPRNKGNSRVLFGAILIATGVFYSARTFFVWLDLRYVFAGLLILGGLYMLLGYRRR